MKGFTWWPYQQAQTIAAVQRDDPGDAIKEVVRIRVATEVRANVPATPGVLIAIAKRNASLAESALVLRVGGMTVLESSHEASERVWLAGNPLAPPLYRRTDQPCLLAALVSGVDFWKRMLLVGRLPVKILWGVSLS